MAIAPPPYSISTESITVVWEGKSYVVQRGTAHFEALERAIQAKDWDSIPKNLTVAKSLKDWAKGKVTVRGENFSFEGEAIPNNINARIIKMASAGEDPTPLFKFWERLKKNPSYRSVNQLWEFMQHRSIPLTKDGCILTYKSVKADYKDVHSGTFDNHPGRVNEMPRNQISDDPQVACHEGFHVGALGYVQSFHSGGNIVICKVDPEDVVCVPYDSSQEKMRVRKYKVMGNYSGSHMPDTYLADEDIPEFEIEEKGPEKEPVGPLARAADALGVDASKPDGGLAKIEVEAKKLIVADKITHAGKTFAKEFMPGETDPDRLIAGLKAITGVAKVLAKRAKKDRKKGKVKPVELPKPKVKGASKVSPKFDKMDTEELLKESIEDLRQYAGKGLAIVGASKIPGGKVALIASIMKVRSIADR